MGTTSSSSCLWSFVSPRFMRTSPISNLESPISPDPPWISTNYPIHRCHCVNADGPWRSAVSDLRSRNANWTARRWLPPRAGPSLWSRTDIIVVIIVQIPNVLLPPLQFRRGAAWQTLFLLCALAYCINGK